MSALPRVTIAGAGALGLSTALALADAGAKVTVCDPGRPNASEVAAGMIAPVFEAVLDEMAAPHLDLLMAARDLWPELAARAGIALDRSGAQAVGDDAWLDAVAARFAALGLRPIEIGGATACALTPGLQAGRALLTREDWRIEPRGALQALRRAAEAAGVVFRPGEVSGRHGADVLVAATGAGRAIAPELERLTPIKGQLACFAGSFEGLVVRTEGAYAAPGATGLIVGATMETGRGDTEPDPHALAPVVAAGRRLFKGLEDPVIAAGVRAATPDGLPMVGWSRMPGVVLAAGARRNGWLLAPLVARMVAACIMGTPPDPFAPRLDPLRF
jgi:glycine oxidase